MSNIEANLEVKLNNAVFFSAEIPIVEFAVELNKWLEKPDGATFKYETIDDEEENIFNIIATSANTYEFQSAWQNSAVIEVFTHANVVEFAQQYIKQVKSLVQSTYNVSVSKYYSL